MQDVNTGLGFLFRTLRERKREREERKKSRKDVPGGHECHSVPDWIVQHLGKRDEANETSDRCSKAPPGFRDVPNLCIPPTNISSVCLSYSLPICVAPPDSSFSFCSENID